MKKVTLTIFKVKNRSVEEIESSEITFAETEKMKTNLAIMHGVNYEDVEALQEDVVVQDLSSTTAISPSGELIYLYYLWTPVKGISPSMDIAHESLFDEWLSLIGKGDIGGAIIFR